MAYLFILLGVGLRLIPHIPNFAPITAMALFGACYLDKKYAIVFPLIAMLISDMFLGFHQVMFWVYGSFVLIGFLGMWLKNHKSSENIVFGSLVGSVIFFLITNFGVWLGPWYSHNLNGFISCYTLALPFFRNTIIGDLFYTGVFFSSFALFSYLASIKQLAIKKI
ncbi:MAG: DUF6580 family putative transport protein [Patescibacteria group bacterium]|jgi:hypothetical protein